MKKRKRDLYDVAALSKASNEALDKDQKPKSKFKQMLRESGNLRFCVLMREILTPHQDR